MSAPLPVLFNRELYLARQAKASGAQTALVSHVAAELADRLSVIKHEFKSCILISSQATPFKATLQASGKFAEISLIAPPTNDNLNLEANSADAIFSLLDLHCVNDVPGYLAQCAKALRPDGLLMACCFGENSLNELRQSWLAAEAKGGSASPRVAPMIGVREMGALLQRAGLALPVADAERLDLRYQNTLALLREIKAFGFSNPLHERRRGLTPPNLMAALAGEYEHAYSENGKIRATVDVLWALAWKPHPSQQQPKKPGSAALRLADALKAPTHEK